MVKRTPKKFRLLFNIEKNILGNKDFFESFSKTPYAIGVVMHFFSDEVYQPYIDKLKESNLPVMEDPSCLLSAIVNREFDCIPWLIEQGLSPYEYVDYNGADMNAFDCIHWQEKLVRMGSTYDAENKRPAIKSSICTGEKVAGFRDIHSGKFEDIQLIRSEKDLDEFKKTYGIEGDIETIY